MWASYIYLLQHYRNGQVYPNLRLSQPGNLAICLVLMRVAGGGGGFLLFHVFLVHSTPEAFEITREINWDKE